MSFLPVQVNAKLAVSEDAVKKNISENMDIIPTWFDNLFYPNGYQAYIISAGPSMEKYVADLNLKERMTHPHRDFLVFCVKHALPRLLAMGVEPDYCVILDGRPFDEDSTHGVNRKALFKKIPEKTIFLVASMSNPGYARYLQVNGARVLGWHTSVTGIDEFRANGLIKEPVITGGTSSGTRCIGIAHALGVRDMTLVGFDSCIHNPTEETLKEKDKKGRQKYQMVDLPVSVPPKSELQDKLITSLEHSYLQDGYVLHASLNKRFWTTGELLAQAHDFEQYFTSTMFDIKFTVLDDGIVGHMFNNMKNKVSRGFSFVEHFKGVTPTRKCKKEYPKRVVTL